MKNYWKRIVVLLMTSIMAFALAACTGGSEPPAAGEQQAGGDKAIETPADKASGGPEKVTLRLLWWGSQTRHDLTMEAIKRYQDLNPNVTIEPEFTGWSGYWEKLAAQVAGNNMPDIIQMNFGEYLTQYAEKDILADLSEFVANGTIDASNVSEGIMKSGEMNGKLLGIPLGMNALTAVYDEQMLKDAGAKLPDFNWTWDDWKEISAAVQKSTGEYGTQELEIGNIFEYYARQNGQKMFNPDATGLGYDDQTLTDFLRMSLEMQEQGLAPTLDVALQYEAVEDQLIVHKKAAFDFRWSNQVVALTKAAQRPLKVAPLPGPNIDQGMYLKPAMFFSVNKDSKVKEEAAKFINWFINDVELNKLLNGDRGVPVSSKVREAMAPSLDDMNKMIFEYIGEVAENSSPIDGNYPPGSSEVIKALEEVNEQVMYKQLTPEEGAAEFRQRAEAIIKRAAK